MDYCCNDTVMIAAHSKNESDSYQCSHCERQDSPKFPSPTSCLPEEELEKLEAKINSANRLLLDLALEDQRSSRETYQRAFDGLEGLDVTVSLNTSEHSKLFGKVEFVGYDFVALIKDKEQIFIPFDLVSTINSHGVYTEPEHEPAFLDADPCLRYDLTHHFGRTVASSPVFIQIFFRISLSNYLLQLCDEEMVVTIDGEEVQGELIDVNKEIMTLDSMDGYKEIPLETIWMISKQGE